jgi:hypothetical protein
LTDVFFVGEHGWISGYWGMILHKRWRVDVAQATDAGLSAARKNLFRQSNNRMGRRLDANHPAYE